MPKIDIENQTELIICGLYLSKFDELGYKKLGFSSFSEAFNVLGLCLNGKAMNIKNYRDEFDPYFDNPRKGWYKRTMRGYCKVVFEKYKNLDLDEFSSIISSFIVSNYRIKKEICESIGLKTEPLKRIATGKAAESYFLENYTKHFENFSLLDTRDFGCGFDFKLSNLNNFFYVEVKGISTIKGNFLLTQNEFEIAKKFSDNYCLFVVRNIELNPFETLIFNPLDKLSLKEIKQEITRISYQGLIDG